METYIFAMRDRVEAKQSGPTVVIAFNQPVSMSLAERLAQ